MASDPEAYDDAQDPHKNNSSVVQYLGLRRIVYLATLNCSGIGITEWDTRIQEMKDQGIDIVALQETHIDINSTLIKENTCTSFLQTTDQ